MIIDKKLILYGIIVLALILIGAFFGYRIALSILAIGAGAEAKKRVDKRKDTIDKAKKQDKRAEKYYEEMKQNHDKEIEEAGEDIEQEEFDNPDDSADYINDFLDSDS